MLHTLECHTKEENASDLQVDRQVDENLPQSRDFGLILLASAHCLAILGLNRWWNGQSACLLQVFDGVEDVAQLGWLDGPTQDLFGLVSVPQFDLENELLKWASLHLRLGVLWHEVFEEFLRAEPEHESLSDTSRTAHALLG